MGILIYKQKKIISAFLFFVYVVLIIISYYIKSLIDPLTWLSISILIISRFPQIFEYSQIIILNPKLVIFVLFLTISANYFYIISIAIDIHVKNNPILLIPWLICKSVIIILDCISIFIVYKNMKKSGSTN
jgi:hypothetical protein